MLNQRVEFKNIWVEKEEKELNSLTSTSQGEDLKSRVPFNAVRQVSRWRGRQGEDNSGGRKGI